jgi:hypothetical protein
MSEFKIGDVVNIRYLPGVLYIVASESTLFIHVKPLYFGENSQTIPCFQSELELLVDETRDNKLKKIGI